MNTQPVITMRNVSKHFQIRGRANQTLLSRIVRSMRSSKASLHILRKHDALQNISFEVHRGEILGVIGRNASGKTTLLRLIAGILQPDEGAVTVRGSVMPLLNLGAGLKQQLRVRDNISLICALYGLDRHHVQRVFPDIVAFGELDASLDMFLYQLSSGMQQRLAFSVAVYSNPEILLLDEVFSAGDMAFRIKSTRKMQDLIQRNTTMLMVSHELPRVRKCCHRVLWLENGEIRMLGDPATVTEAYEMEAKSLVPHP